MTRALLALPLVVLGVVSGAGCVFPPSGIGNDCTDSDDCVANANFCVLLDPEDGDSDLVCLPAPEERDDIPVSCAADADCARAGLPIDSSCIESKCTCSGETFNLKCGSGETVGEHACKCVETVSFGACDDDNQCENSGICGGGQCTDGLFGEACDDDGDCSQTGGFCDTDGTCA